MPRLWGITPRLQERYFLQHGEIVEERVQRDGDAFEYELKTIISPRERRREKQLITEEEFRALKQKASKVLVRESYLISKTSPRILIKKYKGDYSGFVFAQVEFDSIEAMEKFEPLDWMGTEITNSPLGRDAWLLDLDREHFRKALHAEKEKLNPS
jgi:CYTH domain-containing protein